MSNWHPVSVKPQAEEVRGMPWKEKRNLLVWIQDANTFAPGKYVEYDDGYGSFSAAGYNGDWKITHWMEITPP